MINCIIIHNNIINEVKVKNLSEENIYKKCSFKNKTDFVRIKFWKIENNSIELWGKNKGLSNSLNSFELFKNNNINIYGKSLFLMKDDKDKYISLNKDNFLEYFELNENVENIENIENIKNIENIENIKNIENIENVENLDVESTSISLKNIDKDKNKDKDKDKDKNISVYLNDEKKMNTIDNNSEYSYNSELSYELYSYSDDDE